MGSLFCFRTDSEPWGGSCGMFIFPVETSVDHLKKICPKWGDKFQDKIDDYTKDYWPSDIFLEKASLEEEKQILEALQRYVLKDNAKW